MSNAGTLLLKENRHARGGHSHITVLTVNTASSNPKSSWLQKPHVNESWYYLCQCILTVTFYCLTAWWHCRIVLDRLTYWKSADDHWLQAHFVLWSHTIQKKAKQLHPFLTQCIWEWPPLGMASLYCTATRDTTFVVPISSQATQREQSYYQRVPKAWSFYHTPDHTPKRYDPQRLAHTALHWARIRLSKSNSHKSQWDLEMISIHPGNQLLSLPSRFLLFLYCHSQGTVCHLTCAIICL